MQKQPPAPSMHATKARFIEHNARIETTICFAGLFSNETAAINQLAPFIDEEDEMIRQCFPDFPDWLSEAMDDPYESERYFCDWLDESGKFGFLMQFSTPVMTHNASTGGVNSSWDEHYTTWIYGDSFEEALDKGFEWVDNHRKSENKKPKLTLIKS